MKTKHYLLIDFINIIERKGYEREILIHEKGEKADKYDYTTRMEGISKAEILVNEDNSIKEGEYKQLVKKQKDGLLTENETYILDKYFMSKQFKIAINKIDDKFVEEHFRKEYIIDNYNKFDKVKYEDGEKIEKAFNNDMLEDKVEKINDKLKWFKDKDGNKVEYLRNETLRKNFEEYFKDPSIKQLFNTYPKRGGDKKIFDNVNNHILNELGFEFVLKKKHHRDKTSGKLIKINLYTIGYCKILSDYLERKDEQ